MPPITSNIWESFLSCVNDHPDQIACHFKEDAVFKQFSNEELYQRVLQFAQVLKQSDLKEGDHVAILSENHPDFLMAFLSCMAIGATFVPLDIQYSDEQIQSILKHANAAALLISKRTLETKPNIHAQRMIMIDGGGHETIHEEKLEEHPPTKLEHQAVLFYTSGTTSDPKGVVLTHKNILSNIDSLQQLRMMTNKDIVLSFLPLHHAYSFSATMLMPLFTGAQIAFCPSVSSKDLIQTMKEVGVTIFVGVPQVFQLIRHGIDARMKKLSFGKKLFLKVCTPLAKAFHLQRFLFSQIHQNFGGRVRLMVSGGARLDPDVAEAFYQWGFTVAEGYGLTETSPVVAFNPFVHKIKGSVGKTLNGVKVKVHNPNKHGFGEVWIQGDNVMAGYFHNEQATQEVLNEDGWFNSGDYGRLDANDNLYLQGRVKEVIILSNGKNIQPDEIERHYEQISLIKEIGVLAVAPKEENVLEGESLVGLIFLDREEEKRLQSMNVLEQLKFELENRAVQIPPYKRLKGFKIVKDPLPRTRLGKLRRYQFNDIYATAESLMEERRAPAMPAEEERVDIEQTIIAFFTETLKRPVKGEDHLEIDLGLDSLNRIELLLGLQDHIGVNLEEDESMGFFVCNTVHELKEKLIEIHPEFDGVTSKEGSFQWSDAMQSDPHIETITKIKLHFGILSTTANIIAILFFKLLFRIFFLMRRSGKENLPKQGPFLLCPNHTSFLDALFVVGALPTSLILQTYFLGIGRLLESPILKPLNRVARMVPIAVNYQLVETLKVCAYILRQKKILCYFPEGARSVDGDVKDFKKGVGILIKELNIPVVPVYIDGAFKAWNRHHKFPRLAPIHVVFGKPLNSNDLEENISSFDDAYSAIATRLRADVSSLKP